MRAVFFFVAVLVAGPAGAWGALGHRITGQIAEHYAAPATLAAVHAILGPEDLAEASTWPDEMRASPDIFWQRTASPWHYVTVPRGKTYREVGAPPEGDAVTALQRFARTLRDPAASREEKALALRFTIHLVGDLHQPLHAGNGIDHGGNDVRVSWFGRETTLHAVWDSSLPDEKGLSYTEYSTWLLRRITPEDVRRWSSTDPQVWIAESVALRETLYPAESRLGYRYVLDFQPAVDRRLMQAGVRLAAYLDEVLGQKPAREPGK